MEEIWKDIEGFEDYYEVSNWGRIRSKTRFMTVMRNGYVVHNRKTGKILNPVNNRGYKTVFLYNGQTRISAAVHRLVANAFCEKRDGCNEVNHINENKADNRAENLEWVNHEENSNHGTRNKRIAEKHFDVSGKGVMQIDENGNIVNQFVSVYQAERKTGISHKVIYNSLYRGHYAAGYKWQRAI